MQSHLVGQESSELPSLAGNNAASKEQLDTLPFKNDPVATAGGGGGHDNFGFEKNLAEQDDDTIDKLAGGL